MPAQIDAGSQMGFVPASTSASEGDTRDVDVQELLELSPDVSATARRLGKLPAGLWLGSQRLTSWEFLVALSMAVVEANVSGAWPRTVALPRLKSAGAAGAFASLPSRGGGAGRVALTVNGEKNGQVSGVVEVTVSGRHADGMVELCIDGKVRAVSNRLPLSLRWDTKLESDGEHTILVRAVSRGQEIQELAKRRFVIRNAG
jgi:hypothetical protein